jgi:acetylornithine deacetylase/succinyl-diaminopimelate desuccinylase-like protein
MAPRPLITLLILLGLPALIAARQTPAPTADGRRARDIFQQLIEFDTTDEHGATTPAAEALARRLQDAGLPVADIHVLGPTPKKGNLVVRLRGTGARRPLLLLAHLDVVEARREDWSIDPFTFHERDGFFYGRGAQDIKDGAAILVANLIRLAEAHYKPDRDLILALTADEEGGTANGVRWLLADHRELIDAEFCVNLDGGDFQKSRGRRLAAPIQAAEKAYADFTLEVTNRGGHSSLPTDDNAIYHLAVALTRIAAYTFPARLNDVTRGFFAGRAALEPPAVASDMRAVAAAEPPPEAIARLSANTYFNAQLRTTCVATQVTAGHAANALPQRARANVNCRLLPDESLDEVKATLVRVVNDPAVIVSAPAARPNPISPVRPDLLAVTSEVAARVYPGVLVVPTMETGGTDGRSLRIAGIPTYGMSGIFIEEDDVRAHGRDERIGVQDFYDGLEFNYQLIRALTQ